MNENREEIERLRARLRELQDKPPKVPRVPLNTWIPLTLSVRLREESEKLKVSMVSIIREAIEREMVRRGANRP